MQNERKREREGEKKEGIANKGGGGIDERRKDFYNVIRK